MCFECEKSNTGKYTQLLLLAVLSAELIMNMDIEQSIHQRQREMLKDSLFMVDLPLSWDVESDMELVLSDMTVSSEIQKPFRSQTMQRDI